MKKFLTIIGVLALLLTVYALLQSVLATGCTWGALYYGSMQGAISGNILEIMEVQDISSLPSVVQGYYFAGMSTGLFLSAVLMLLLIHVSGLFRMRMSLFRSISARPLFLATALVFTSMWVLNIFVQWFPLKNHMETQFDGISHNLLGALTISFVAPVLEEVMFRGAIQGYMTRKTGKPVLSIVIASLVFGIFHMNPIQIVYASLLGMILGWIYYRTGSLLSVIVGHVLNNTIATFTMLTMADVDEKEVSNASPGYVAFAFFAVLSILLVIKLNKALPPVPSPWHESDEPKESAA